MGGLANFATGQNTTTVGGGAFNRATALGGTISGGGGLGVLRGNQATGNRASVGGGYSNEANGAYDTIAGGKDNNISGANTRSCTVTGGMNNTMPPVPFTHQGYCTIPGGRDNSVAAQDSFAAGRRARSSHDGAFVWGDCFDGDKLSSTIDQFSVYASGGTRIFSDTAASTGALLAPGSGAWTSVSDRNAKENIKAVDGREVLEQLAEISIASWSYKAQDEEIRHMGPMAQDFYATFELGSGPATIAVIDADGVALAAIQGLNNKMDDGMAALDGRLISQSSAMSSLRSDLARLRLSARTLEIARAAAPE